MSPPPGAPYGIVSVLPVRVFQFFDIMASVDTTNDHPNRTTARSRVGSPASASSASVRDDLPAFSRLTNDEDRERKAEATLPGTYSVVVTPKSFADLPEYASTSSPQETRSQQSTERKRRTFSNPGGRTRSSADPNVVVLDRFEELTATTSLPASLGPPGRQEGLPESLQHMSLSMTPSSGTSSQPTTPSAYVSPSESRLVSHFRRYIVGRLVPNPLEDTPSDNLTPGSIRDLFELEATKFPPVSRSHSFSRSF